MTIASANNASGSIFFADSTTGDEAYKGRIEYNHGTNKLQFGANSVIHTTLDASGNFGIGEASPKAKLHVVGGTASNGDGVYYYENVAFKDGSSSETGTLKITLPMFNSTTMTKFTIEGYDYSGGARGQSWTVKVGGYMYSNNNWYNYYAHLEGRPPFSSVRLANDGSKNVILLGTTSTTWTYPKIVITEVLAGFNNGDDWGSGYDISWITSETGIGNISTPNIDYRMASNGDSIFSVVKTQDSSDTADYVKMYHDGSDGYLISNRGQLRLSSQSGIDALKIDSSGNVSLSNNLSLTNGSPVMYMSGSSGDHTRFGWTEGDPDVAYWRFYQNSGLTASITMDAITENTAGGRIEFNTGASEVAIASIDSGGVTLDGNVQILANHTLEFTEGASSKIIGPLNQNFVIESRGNSTDEGVSIQGADGAGLHVNKAGRVGIGTTSPSYPGLHISNSTPYLALEDSDGTNQKIDILHSGGGTFFTGRNGNAYGSFVFRGYNGSAYATAVTIDSSQRVGIQESNPTEALHVKGNIKTNGELIGKTYVTFVHNFSDDMGTSAHTIPWTDGNEGPDNSKSNTNFVAPYPMSLVKIIVRPTAVQNSGALRVTLKKEDDGDGTNDTVATATPSGNLASNTAKVVTASDFDNTPDIGILDKINIELSTSVDVNTSSTDWFVTTVWTMDVN
jgi:hypothetical protein